jgi:hypothetical protein
MLANRSMPLSTVTPVLVYPDLAKAVDWLCDAFGFTERLRINEGVRPRKGTRFLLAYVCKDCGFTGLYRTERPGLIPPKIPD